MFAESNDVSLAEIIAQEAPIGVDETVRILIKLTEAVSGLHERGIIHGDLTPEHFLFEPDGKVRVLISIVDCDAPPHRRLFPRCVECASPEVTLRIDMDARSDVYSIGAIGYLLVAGRFPYDSPDIENPFTAQITPGNTPQPLCSIRPGCSVELSNIIQRALATLPDGRFDGTAAMLEQLKSIK